MLPDLTRRRAFSRSQTQTSESTRSPIFQSRPKTADSSTRSGLLHGRPKTADSMRFPLSHLETNSQEVYPKQERTHLHALRTNRVNKNSLKYYHVEAATSCADPSQHELPNLIISNQYIPNIGAQKLRTMNSFSKLSLFELPSIKGSKQHDPNRRPADLVSEYGTSDPKFCPPRLNSSIGQETQSKLHTPSLRYGSLMADSTTPADGEMKEKLISLLDRRVFARLLECAEIREELRGWLELHEPLGPGILNLDRWQDENRLIKLTSLLRQHCDDLSSFLYRNPSTFESLEFPSEVYEKSSQKLSEMSRGLDGQHLAISQKWLMSSLYKSEFQKFITSKLTKQNRVKLARSLVPEDQSGLGESFVLFNARQSNHQIRMVSPGFTVLTGYEREGTIGARYNFHTGPRPSETSVERIQEALRNQHPCVELLINYRRDQSPYYSLLNIIPLLDKNGEVTYVLLGEVDVTRELDSFQKLYSLILPGKSPTYLAKNPINRPDKSRPTKNSVSNMQHEPTFTPGPSFIQDNIHRPRKVLGPKINDKKAASLNWLPGLMRWKRRQDSASDGKSSLVISTSSSKVPRDLKKFMLPAQQLIDTCEPTYMSDEVEETYPEAEDMETWSKVEVTECNSPFEVKETNPLTDFPLEESTCSKLRWEEFNKSLTILSYEIVSITPEALDYLGLPIETKQDVYDSPIWNLQFVDLVTGATSKHTENLRNRMTNVIQQGIAASCQCVLSYKLAGLKPRPPVGENPGAKLLLACKAH
ncbi:hypothetical protein CROQUDRAFT_136578 [Cronartium quercuum f. sp. fusiforme G11]|uniref:PAC domain-containing protein n=1 Tax=Cronartium quercuum f. sp. fusiforme G11 TaxID=708437 RepID=A0A9P6NAG5_9BASI|nr:hypothetical protein CROQUDRAFT_136578 [Cronartium quercuum f. sp. fusiforme G11]